MSTDLKRRNVPFSPPDMTEAEASEVRDAILSGWITTGPRTKKLEKEVAEFVGVEKAVCLNSQTACAEMALRLLGVGEGDEVIVPTPGYVCYGPDTLLAGGKPVYLELKEENQFKVTPEALEKAITPKTKMLILNYPSNPTGGIMTKADYEKIIPIIKKHKIIVLADEIYAELTYAGKHCSLGNFPEIKDQLILMNGISKAYSMTGWRLGYILADKEIIQALSIIQDYVLISAPTITQYAAIEALNHGDKDATMMKESFEERRNYLVSECNRIGLTCHSPLGAFYVFPNIKKTGLSSYELASRLMKEAKVAVIPGSAFGPAGEGYIRLSYSYSIDQIKEAISRIEAFLKTI